MTKLYNLIHIYIKDNCKTCYFTRILFSRCHNNNRYITKQSHLYISYESRHELFKLDRLELSRLIYDLALIYQISNKHTAVDRYDILFYSTPIGVETEN